MYDITIGAIQNTDGNKREKIRDKTGKITKVCDD